jgi:tRNA(Ile)-lysidine synthase
VDDPSNLDPRFARPRLRATLLPRLAAEGLDAARLGTLATRVARCEAALREAADQLAAHARLDAEAGARRFDAGRLAAAPLELVIRVLGSAVQEVGCAGTPRLDRLEKVAAGLQTAVARGEALKRTLAGTILSMSAEKVLDVRAEGARRRGAPARAAHAVHRVGRE